MTCASTCTHYWQIPKCLSILHALTATPLCFCSVQDRDVPCADDMEALLRATADEQMQEGVQEVSHFTTHASLGSLLGGHITTPEGQNQYIIPDFQRTYSWDAARAGAMARDLLKLFKMGLREHRLGDILLYKREAGQAQNSVSCTGKELYWGLLTKINHI